MDLFNYKEFTTQAGALKQDRGAWRQSIPAQVFLNHFFAIDFHIRHTDDRYDLKDVRFFSQMKAADQNTDRIERWLYNAWSTEYALRSTAKLGDEEYIRFALHWSFPQAFYSIYMAMQAFMATHGIEESSFDRLSLQFGRMVANGAYPRAISFYADGYYGNFHVHKIRPGHFKPGLFPAAHELEADAQIAQFLCTTRKMKAREVKSRLQANPEKALRSVRTGKALQKFSAEQWKEIGRIMGYTTVIDLMGRLRMSTGFHEIQRFVQADIDFTLFHKSLCELVSYLNFVHESYIARAIGFERYCSMVEQLPPHLKNGFVSRRLSEHITPLFEKGQHLSTTAA